MRRGSLQLQAQRAIESVRAQRLWAGRIVVIARLANDHELDGTRRTTDQLQRLWMNQRRGTRHSHHAEKPRQHQA